MTDELSLGREELRNKIFQRLWDYFEARGEPDKYREVVEQINSHHGGQSKLVNAYTLGLEARRDGSDLVKGMEYLGSFKEDGGQEVKLYESERGIFEVRENKSGERRMTLVRSSD